MIENKSDKYLLHIRLSFEQDIEVFLEIDEYTAENLKAVTQLDEKYKYRLSFKSSWDVIQKQYVSILTRTYREQSNPINFSCSEDYINKLTTIKHTQHISDLDKLTFISTNLALIDEQREDKKQEQNEDTEENTLKKYITKFKQSSIT
ncbi:MAG: hypothetical protein IMZ41_02155, partial [Actinobacteria bacterium]|nr:hypothetical protein [Actinomycetota bacterium]